MSDPDNVAWLWHPRHPEPEGPIKVTEPENELDGDRLWIWVGGGQVRMTWEEVTGEESAAARWLLLRHPELADLPISGDSPNSAFETLADLAAFTEPVRHLSDVETWFHGTSSTRLDAILNDGLHGEMAAEGRSWRNVIDPDTGVVYLAANRLEALSYARKAVAAFGGEEAVIEIPAASLADAAFIEDRDFRHTHEWAALCAGEKPGIDPAEASLNFSGKVGHVGRIHPGAISAVQISSSESADPCPAPAPR